MKASKIKLEKLFKKFDKNTYDLEGLIDMEKNLGKICSRIASQYSETRLGSARAKNFIEAIHKRIPQIYIETIKDFKESAKRAEKDNKRDNMKLVNEIQRQKAKLQDKLDDMQIGPYIDTSESDDRQDTYSNSSSYSSDSSSNSMEFNKKQKPRKKSIPRRQPKKLTLAQ